MIFLRYYKCFLTYLQILNLDKEVIGMSCLLSFELMRKVNKCPRNKDEWNVRADMFNCSSINQTCVQTDMFQYHCVLNSNGTELLETCAPIKYIYGNVLNLFAQSWCLLLKYINEFHFLFVFSVKLIYRPCFNISLNFQSLTVLFLSGAR